jgi:5,10-methylenetetrahydromethanopterin reductase
VTVELWRTGFPIADPCTLGAAAAESDGWDGIWVMDSQNLSVDPFVAMAVAAEQTTRLKLGTGVTNLQTRHVATTAAAAASVQVLSGGRCVIGVGRGDSALAYAGVPPWTLAEFERSVASLRALLSGESVTPLEAEPDQGQQSDKRDQLDLRLQWLPESYRPVPIELVASGPRMLGVAARNADWITLSVGADPNRLQWAMDLVAQELSRCGRDADDLHFSAYVCVCVHDDVALARTVVADMVATLARFNAMSGSTSGPWSDTDRQVAHAVAASYAMSRHADGGRIPAGVLPDAFIDRFAIVGSAAACLEKLAVLRSLGIERLVVASGPRASGPGELIHSSDRALLTQVAPALRDIAAS